VLIPHEVEGRTPTPLAGRSAAGAIAALLMRVRARLRVEYLLTLQGDEPPTALPLDPPQMSGDDRGRTVPTSTAICLQLLRRAE
jgi:hypothetical protein